MVSAVRVFIFVGYYGFLLSRSKFGESKMLLEGSYFFLFVIYKFRECG